MIVLAPLAIVLEKLSGLVHFSKEVLIIVIKLTQGRDHRSGGSIRVDPLKIFFKKRDQNNDVFNQKSFFQKIIIKLRVGFYPRQSSHGSTRVFDQAKSGHSFYFFFSPNQSKPWVGQVSNMDI